MIGRMIELLDSELVAKSENYYPDPALGHVFLINNLSYIEQKTRDLKLNNDWFRQNAAKVEQYCNVQRRRMSQQANAHVDSTLGTSPEDGDFRFRGHLLTQSSSHSQDDVLIIQQLMNCVKELEKENLMLVRIVCSHVDKYLKTVFDSKEVPDPDINLVLDSHPPESMRRLKESVKLMVNAGFMEECSDIYGKWRREFLEQCLLALGLQFQTPNNKDVAKWLTTCMAAVNILFPNEKRLCSYIFSGIYDAAVVSFFDKVLFPKENRLCSYLFSDFFVTVYVYFEKVCMELTISLLSFADTTITTGSNSRNLLFNIVPKMSESLDELLLEFTSHIFKPSFLRDLEDIKQILDMLNRFRDIIYPDNASAPVTDGGLHLIIAEAMNYIHTICKGKIRQRADQTFRNSSFWVVIGRMIELLESELEAKSKKYYADIALGYVFMMNTLNYIEQKMHDLKLDDDWFRQNTAKVEQNCNLYLTSSWDKVVEFLKVETNDSAEADVVAELMKRKLHLFNMYFEETCTIQSTWTVSNKRLKERIIKSIEDFLLPQYGKFCDRFRVVFGNQAYHYIKFGFLDIQNSLSHLFLLDEEMNTEDKKNI